MKSPVRIIQIDENKSNPLRKRSLNVPVSQIKSKEISSLISLMKESLSKEHDGVAIASPQIGVNLRVFVISEKAYSEDSKFKPLVFINPKIIKQSKKKIEQQEGCLSVRWIYGKTKRYSSVTVEAYDENGNKFTYGAGGLIAHICQHEIEHLDGILFIDHGYDLEEFTEEEVKSYAK